MNSTIDGSTFNFNTAQDLSRQNITKLIKGVESAFTA